MSNVKPIEIGEILVVADRTTRKKFAGEIVGRHKNQIKLEVADKYGTCETHDIDIAETHTVLSYLGSTPKSGSVYGCQIRKLYAQAEHDFWGVMTFFRELDEEEKDVLKGALTGTYKRLKKIGLHRSINLDNFIVQEAKGKYAGSYSQDRNGIHIFYHPKEIESKFSTFLMDHEIAHAIWAQVLTETAKASWVRLYTTYIAQTKTPEDDLEYVVEVLESNPRYAYEYRELVADTENGEAWLDKILYALMGMLMLDKDALDLYLWSSTRKERKKLVRAVMVSVSPVQSDYDESFPISDYARKNVYEFFAEAYCHYISKPSYVPEDVENLLVECMPSIKGIRGLSIIKDDEDEEEDE